jgi:hypothetical protein
MLWTLAFDRLGVVMSDLYFVDPSIDQGAGGAERGVRLELRFFERDDLKGSVYSAVPIRIDRPIWRVDLLETVESEPGSLNRAHHHARFHDWDPGRRIFVQELSDDPVRWVRDRFEQLDAVLADAGIGSQERSPDDVESLRGAAAVVANQLEFMLAEVAAGRAGLPPAERTDFVRQSWL